VTEFLAAIFLLLAGGAAAIGLRPRARWNGLAGQAGAIAGSAIGLVGGVRLIVSGQPEELLAPSFMPGGAMHLQIDALSAFFLLPVFGLSIVTAIYGGAYMTDRGDPRRAAASWFHMNLLTAGMATVIAAHDGLLFLVAWEIMALAPFFLVIFNDREPAVRHAGWTYLAATHIGTAFLLVLFVVLGDLAGSSDFDA
jgi:hydrogenase-4 component B